MSKGVATDPHGWLQTQEKRAQLPCIPMCLMCQTCQICSHGTQCNHPSWIIPARSHSLPPGVLHGIQLHPVMAWTHTFGSPPPHTDAYLVWIPQCFLQLMNFHAKVALLFYNGYIRWRIHYGNKVLSFTFRSSFEVFVFHCHWTVSLLLL